MKLRQLAIAIDQFFNVVFGGYADETLSARAFRMRYRKKRWLIICTIIDNLFFWQEEHCFNSYLNERKRKHLPTDYS